MRPLQRYSLVWVAVAAALVGTVGRAAGEDHAWSRFRGPNGSGIAADKGYPVELSPARNLRWRTAVRSGKSSPVLSRRHVFLTAFEAGTFYTQCFDRATGRLLWERSARRDRTSDLHALNEPASSTPVTDGENVYVFFGDLGAISYDAAGTLRWQRSLGKFAPRMGASASPIVAGSSLILVLDQFDGSSIVALSLASGEVQWTQPRTETDGWSTPLVYEAAGVPPQIVTASAGQYGAHAVATGERLWSHGGLAPAIVASPVVAGHRLYGFGYGYDSYPTFAETLRKFDRDRDGRVSVEEAGPSAWMRSIATYIGDRDGFATEAEWNKANGDVVAPSSLVAVALDRDAAGRVRPRELWRYEKSFVGVVPSPLVLDGLVYTIKNGGILTILSADSGEVVKTGRVGSAPASFSASPVSADGRVYVASEDGTLFVLSAGKDWTVLAANEIGEPIFATPALAGGRLFVRGTTSLFAFGAP